MSRFLRDDLGMYNYSRTRTIRSTRRQVHGRIELLVSIGLLALSFDAVGPSRPDIPASCSDVTWKCIKLVVHSALSHPASIRPHKYSFRGTALLQ